MPALRHFNLRHHGGGGAPSGGRRGAHYRATAWCTSGRGGATASQPAGVRGGVIAVHASEQASGRCVKFEVAVVVDVVVGQGEVDVRQGLDEAHDAQVPTGATQDAQVPGLQGAVLAGNLSGKIHRDHKQPQVACVQYLRHSV